MLDRRGASVPGWLRRPPTQLGALLDWWTSSTPSRRCWASSQSWNICLHWNCWSKQWQEKILNTRIKTVYEDSYNYIEEEEEKRLLFHSIDVNDSNNLKECNDEKRYRAHVAVEDLHPVVPWTLSEDESHWKGYQADDRWGSNGKEVQKGNSKTTISFSY